MPTCNFWSYGNDHRIILEHLLAEGTCRIFESYSAPDRELIEFRRLEDFEKRFGLESWDNEPLESLSLRLYPVDAGGAFQINRISLLPEKCDGAIFRYCCEGWGLVQLYLDAPYKNELRLSHTGHNSEKRAYKWEPTYPELLPPSDWNWKAIESFSRRLNQFIHKCSVERIGSQRILPWARDYLKKAGKLPHHSPDDAKE